MESSEVDILVESQVEESQAQTKPKTSVRFTKRQWILIFVFAILNIVSTMAYSLQAPFYPAEAERKGASATEYGFVFGIFEVTIFFMSPVFGKYMNKLGIKTVFNVCILITSVSVICFGFLDRIEDRTTFIALSIICRFFEGFGCGGFLPATSTIIACEFDSVATVFAALEGCAGLGLIIGPTVGEALYLIGGFPLPFHAMGFILLVSALICSFVIPKMDKALNKDGTDQAGYSIWKLLKFPIIAFAFINLAAGTISEGFVMTLLEPHLRQFGLSPMQTGLMFVIMGGTYSVSSPIWGFICDRIRKPIYVTILGNVLIFIAFLFIGPAPFIPIETTLWAIITGLVLQGLGFACLNVSAFSVGLKESVNNGLPDNISTNSAVSGLWQSMVSLGAWLGPIIGGLLFDNVGFRQGCWLVLATSVIMGNVLVIHECTYKPANSPTNVEAECQPLLQPNSSSSSQTKKVIFAESESTYGTVNS